MTKAYDQGYNAYMAGLPCNPKYDIDSPEYGDFIMGYKDAKREACE